jgi:hypothetical protein
VDIPPVGDQLVPEDGRLAEIEDAILPEETVLAPVIDELRQRVRVFAWRDLFQGGRRLRDPAICPLCVPARRTIAGKAIAPVFSSEAITEAAAT